MMTEKTLEHIQQLADLSIWIERYNTDTLAAVKSTGLVRVRLNKHDSPVTRRWWFDKGVERQIIKTKAKERVVYVPKDDRLIILKALAKKLGEWWGDPVPEAFAYLPNKGCYENALHHSYPAGSQPTWVRMDIKSFFPSITAKRVFGLFTSYGMCDQVATAVTALCTAGGRPDCPEHERSAMREYRVKMTKKMKRSYDVNTWLAEPADHLAIGLNTSPVISNMIMFDFDVRMRRLAQEHGYRYSRYCDDIIVSSDTADVRIMMSDVVGSIRANGFNVNDEKTLVQNGFGRVTGYICEPGKLPHLSRKQRRLTRYMLLRGTEDGSPFSRSVVDGHLAYAQKSDSRPTGAVFKNMEWAEMRAQ